MEWAKNWVTGKIADYATLGIQAGGSLAGNAVGGVGSLIENSGHSVGQGTSGIAGAIGGVGGYINNYGESIRNSMAADGPVRVSGGVGSEAKKKKNVPTSRTTGDTHAVKRTANGTTKTVAGATRRSTPALKPSATSTTTPPSPPRPITTTSSKLLPPVQQPSPTSQPQPPRRILPTKKPIPATSSFIKPLPSTAPPITATTAKRRPSPQSATGGTISKPAAAPVRAPVSTRQSPTRADGKVRIAPESRPRGIMMRVN